VLVSPFWHLDPRADRSRLRAYDAVDLLVASPQVAGTSTARLDSSLSLELGLREPPPYLPGRVSAELKGKTTRQGASYGQERSAVLSAGRTLPLGAGGRVLSLSGSWEQGRDYALKLRKRAAALDSSLRWNRARTGSGSAADGSRTSAAGGTLRANHHLAWRRETQDPADPDLQLVPGRPELEPVVPLRPDKQVLENELLLEYSWQRPAREATLGPPFLRRLALDAQSQSPGVVRHSERILLDSELVFADRALLADDVLMPLSVSFEHSSTMEISDALQLELFAKGLGGVEETIEAGESVYRPALGFELRLTFSLFF
jgi:hypothetical protein